jgi:hypothetical protein
VSLDICRRKNPDPFQGEFIGFACSEGYRYLGICEGGRFSISYLLEIPDFAEQYLMISTDGTTRVITEAEIPTVE